MSGTRIVRWLPVLLALLALAGLWLWLGRLPRLSLSERMPGTDRPPEGSPGATGELFTARGRLAAGAGVPSAQAGSWPGFRGAARDGVARDGVRLARSWGEAGPRALWRLAVGEGHAGVAVHAGRVYLLDFDTNTQADVVRCLSLDDGRDIWRYAYPVRVKRNHGMSRTIPAVTDRHVVTLGPKCHVVCLDAADGQLRWGMDLVREYGTQIPPWYAGQCPLIDGDRVILAPAGDSTLMIAADAETGRVVWRTPNPRGWTMTHASITPVTIAGRRQYVYSGSGGVAGVSAEDGAILWDSTDWKISIATIASAVDLGDGRLFLSGGYEAGCAMMRVAERDGRLVPETLWRLPAKLFGATQQTPVWYEGHVYGVRPDGQLICLSADGKVVWSSGPACRFGLGPYTLADGLIYALSDNGVLRLAEAAPASYRQLAEARVLSGHDAWGPMALAGGRLFARDLSELVCLDVSEAGIAQE